MRSSAEDSVSIIQNGVEQAGESLNERIQVLEAAADNSISVIRAGSENLKGHIRDMNLQMEQAAGQVNAKPCAIPCVIRKTP